MNIGIFIYSYRLSDIGQGNPDIARVFDCSRFIEPSNIDLAFASVEFRELNLLYDPEKNHFDFVKTISSLIGPAFYCRPCDKLYYNRIARRNLINAAARILAPMFLQCIKNAKCVPMNFIMKIVLRDI